MIESNANIFRFQFNPSLLNFLSDISSPNLFAGYNSYGLDFERKGLFEYSPLDLFSGVQTLLTIRNSNEQTVFYFFFFDPILLIGNSESL
jgi:hypothetical protein